MSAENACFMTHIDAAALRAVRGQLRHPLAPACAAAYAAGLEETLAGDHEAGLCRAGLEAAARAVPRRQRRIRRRRPDTRAAGVPPRLRPERTAARLSKSRKAADPRPKPRLQ